MVCEVRYEGEHEGAHEKLGIGHTYSGSRDFCILSTGRVSSMYFELSILIHRPPSEVFALKSLNR